MDALEGHCCIETKRVLACTKAGIVFRALGAVWSIHCRNKQDTVLTMETSPRHCRSCWWSSPLDPVLIPQDVDIEIRIYPVGGRPTDTYMTRIDGDQRLWLLGMAASRSTRPTTRSASATAFHGTRGILLSKRPGCVEALTPRANGSMLAPGNARRLKEL